MSEELLYKAFPLSQGQIRLLTIDRGDDPVIVTHLRVAELANRPGKSWSWLASFWVRPHYEALSYHWGAADVPKQINCEGRTLQIRENLYNALIVLRQLRPGTLLWIDSICIDQKNGTEKLAQIEMMGHIYSAARRVWAFIGMAPPGMSALQPFLPRIIQVCQTQRSQAEKYANSAIDTTGPREAFLGDLESVRDQFNSDLAKIAPHNPSIWATLNWVMTREYFNRLWILQEVALAREVNFLCGNHILKWSHMELLLQSVWPTSLFPALVQGRQLNNNCFQIFQVLGDSSSWSGWWNMYIMRLILRLLSYVVQRYKTDLQGEPTYEWLVTTIGAIRSDALGRLLKFSRSQKCSEPVDRIFALTGIIEISLGEADLPWLAGSQKPEQVYLEAFYFLAQGKQSLDILRLAPPASSCTLSLPSWCPDFHKPRRSYRTSDGFSDMDQGLYGQPWQASKSNQIVAREGDPTMLAVQGIRVGKIVRVFPDWETLALNDFKQSQYEVDEKVKYIASWIHETREHFQSLQDWGESKTQEVFWHTLALQDSALNRIDNKATLVDFDALGALLHRIWSSQSTYQEERTHWFASRPGRSTPTVDSPLYLLDKIDNNMNDKILFLTEDKQIGLGFPGVQEGDSLVVLRGATVPHILRPSHGTNGTWKFHGESYMHGFMHGEAETVDINGLKPTPETFILV